MLDAVTLEETFKSIYPTQADTLANSVAQQNALIAKLKQYTGDQTRLVFLSSFGTAHTGASTSNPEFGRVAQAINTLGGTYEAVYNVNAGDTYSMIAWADPVTGNAGQGVDAGSRLRNPNETDSDPTLKTGVLRGILGRARQGNWYHPITSSAVEANFVLFSALALTKPWPAFTGTEQNAYTYISQKLCNAEKNCADDTDVRPAYTNLSFVIDTALNTLNQVSLPPDANFTSQELTDMKTQLTTELGYVDKMLTIRQNLSDLYTQVQSTSSDTLRVDLQNINNSLQPPNDQAVSIMENVVGNLMSFASTVTGVKYTGAGALLGVLNAAFGFGTTLANEVDGSSAITDVNTPGAGVAQAAVDGFLQQVNTLDVMYDAIVEDWGKLELVGQTYVDLDPKKFTPMVNDLIHAARIATYQSLLPALYNLRTWNVNYPLHYPPCPYYCFIGTPGDYKTGEIFPTSIFRNFDQAGGEYWQYNYLTSPSPRIYSDSAAHFANDFIVLTRKGDENGDPSFSYDQMPTNLRYALFVDVNGPQAQTIQFFRHWPFERRYCSGPGYSISDSNCDSLTPLQPQ